MKKYIIVAISIIALFTSCNNSEEMVFDYEIPKDSFRFEAVQGGAILHYDLPENKEIYYINVNYTNAFGEEVLRSGSYAANKIYIDGFKEAASNVEATITLLDKENNVSEPYTTSFSTLNALLYDMVVDGNVKVVSHWNGFAISYTGEEGVQGLINIHYLAKNPISGELEREFFETFQILEGEQNEFAVFENPLSAHTVMISTEDFNNNIIAEKNFDEVETFKLEKFDSKNIKFIDPNDEPISIEDAEIGLGVSFLFDGYTKGELGFGMSYYEQNTFLSTSGAVGKPFILDLGAEEQIANVRIYAMLNVRRFPDPWSPDPEAVYGDIWMNTYSSKIPCSVTIFGSNDIDATEDKWVELDTFEQDKYLDVSSRWCERSANSPNAYFDDYQIATRSDLEAADPIYLTLEVPVTQEKFRYIKCIVNDTFFYVGGEDENYNGHIVMEEIEVYVRGE